jgi:transcriptional regulator with XRE-family HTH domain
VEDLKSIVAKNITNLRQSAKLTQIELAERLNYSDKAISKWERGEALPDLENLIAIPDYFLYTQDGSNFDIPRTVDLIGAKAFSHTKIDHLFIPGNVGVIQSLACNSNEYIEKITIEKGVD